MRTIRLLLLVMLVLLVVAFDAPAQMSWSNGVLGFNLSNAGRIRVGLTPYASTTREVDRFTIVVALSPTAVFDYNNDQNPNALEPAQRIVVAGVDTAFEALTDNSYSNTPPKIKVRVAGMSWKNQRFLIVRYRVINDTTISMALAVGGHVLPYASSVYGGETIKYHAASHTGYYYKTAKYWGLHLLGKSPTSFRAMDWDVWSSDPNSEVTTDSMRYAVTTVGGPDSLALASADGSIMQLNAGQSTIAPGDSATYYYALVYGTSLAEMVASVDSAEARFNKVFTGVRQTDPALPEAITLSQNYPNPFNPSTQIEFALPSTGFVNLSVYDMLGRLVGTLVNTQLPAGIYQSTFNAGGLAGGVYFYRLTTGKSSTVRQMLLLK